MASHVRSLSDVVAPSLHLISSDSLPLLPGHIESLSTLTAPETLRLTLALTRSESYWRLTHSSVSALANRDSGSTTSRMEVKPIPETANIDPLLTALDVSQHTARPVSRLRKTAHFTQRAKCLPTEKDYKRMLTRLDKIITGSAFSFRSMHLSESRPLDLNLDTGEWQFLRVKTQGFPTPMKVVVRRNKGVVKVYVSRTVQEPKELAYDEVFTRDTILISDSNFRFMHPFIFLGIHCLNESSFSLSLHFGSTHKKHNSVSRLPSLADLNEFRKNETKHLELEKKVEEILTTRKMEREIKYSDRDYVRENRTTLGKREDEVSAKRDMEIQRREEALRRHMNNLKEKKIRAQTIIRRREIRLEAEARARAEELERQRLLFLQQFWLSLSSFFSLSDNLHSLFLYRKERLEQVSKRLKAALTLQRCYRKIVLTINPRRLVKQHALHHLSLFISCTGHITTRHVKETIFAMIKGSKSAMNVRNALEEYYGRSKG